jgi:hypothetical protein
MLRPSAFILRRERVAVNRRRNRGCGTFEALKA